MEKFIDILSRLIIATITFVAPMIVFCFGIFYEALHLSKKDKEKEEKEIAEKAFALMALPEADKVAVLKDTNKHIRKKWSESLSHFLLNPIFEIIFIFSCLFFSIGTLMFSYLVQENVLKMYNHFLWLLLLNFSFWSYFLAVSVIIIFVINIIKMKAKVEKKKLNQ